MDMRSNNSSVTFSCTALMGTNKTGTLTPDEDGYYTLVVGAVNAFNSVGAFYTLEPALALFEESSSFMRRVKEGNCKGETGHPKPLPGQTTRDFIQRVLTIEETRVCAHFKSFTLDKDSVKDKDGNPVIAIIAEVKPAGPMGPALKEALDNKHENVCFSIRSLTQDSMGPGGIIHKNLKTIVTFDWVTEPGIAVARKWDSPSLEGLNETTLRPDHLESIEEQGTKMGTGFESAGLDIDAIRKDLGWSKAGSAKTDVPVSASW